MDCRPNSSTRGCDASLIETLCDLLRAGEAGRANVVDDGKEIIIALGTCGTAHRGADNVSLLRHTPHTVWASSLPAQLHAAGLSGGKGCLGAA